MQTRYYFDPLTGLDQSLTEIASSITTQFIGDKLAIALVTTGEFMLAICIQLLS